MEFAKALAKRAKSATPVKAGIMLYEDVSDQEGKARRKLLVGYNEGRFAKQGQHLVLAKGSIDAGESALHAALREVKEETGFPVAAFLGEKNITQLEQGKTLHNISNPNYPGIEILEASPMPYKHVYHSRAGVEQAMVMFGFKVRGIEQIRPYLKNKEGKTTTELLKENPSRPRFPTFLSWMEQGYIPAEGDLPRIELCDPVWFAEVVRANAPGELLSHKNKGNRENWQAFCAAVPDRDYKKMREAFHAIKARLKAQGWVKGDDDILKFDEKDCPLFWYAEGGYIGDSQEILVKTFKDMEENPDYKRAFGGAGTRQQGLAPKHATLVGQIAAYSSFVKDHVWRGAVGEVFGSGAIASTLIAYGRMARAAANGR